MMDELGVKRSTAQVLPGAKATKTSSVLLTKVWDELTGDVEIETEDMF